jgi:hypothetical protein
MELFKRTLNIELPPRQSTFLWGITVIPWREFREVAEDNVEFRADHTGL